MWNEDNPDGFVRYLADGLKKDLDLKHHIEKNIKNRNGEILVIEERMLSSIQECISLSGLSEQEVHDAKRLPDFASICRDLSIDELFYTIIQKMGSHAVHGTWSDLVFNYLGHEENQGFYQRDHDVETQDVQFIAVSRLVLAALGAFLNFVTPDPADVADLISTLGSINQKLIEIQGLAWASEFVIG